MFQRNPLPPLVGPVIESPGLVVFCGVLALPRGDHTALVSDPTTPPSP